MPWNCDNSDQNIKNSYYIFSLFIACMHISVHATACLWKPEDNLQDSVLSFHYVCPRDWIELRPLGLIALFFFVVFLFLEEKKKSSLLTKVITISRKPQGWWLYNKMVSVLCLTFIGYNTLWHYKIGVYWKSHIFLKISIPTLKKTLKGYCPN